MKNSILNWCRLVVASLCLFLTISAFSQTSTTNPPLMGWASWNHFAQEISDSLIRIQTDAMIASGLSAAGYKYINIDDGFFDGRYPNGALRIDAVKFPKGMKPVADYIHSKGLKAGFYSEAGANTCGSMWGRKLPGGIGVGLYNHDQQDIDTIFRAWGYDFLKVDYCGAGQQRLDERTRYTAIRKAIDNTGIKNINYNICRWQFPGTWVTTIADSWRMSQDITNTWASVTSIIDKNTFLAPYASKGHYNDMDMLEVGRGLTADEDKSHFSMWCILSSPLVLGNDLVNITQQTKDILTNAEVIAVNQDTSGLQGHLISDNGAGLQVWAKSLKNKLSTERAVVLFNRSAAQATISVKWKDLDLVGAAKVRDLWAHADLGSMDSMYTATIPSHGVVMLKITGTKARLQEVFEAEYAWINDYNLTQYSEIVANKGKAQIDAKCSGRAKAAYLGNHPDNYIEFRDIYSNAADNYQLTIWYICGENKNGVLTVNGKETPLTNLNSGGWSTIGSSKFTINLSKGYNTIRISNATQWLPDLDKIHINLN